MAAFSYQHHPFLLDSIFLPDTPIKMSGFMEEGNLNNTTTSFSQFYPSEPPLQEIPVDFRLIHQSNSSLEQQHSSMLNNNALSDNELSSVTKKLSTDSSSLVDNNKLESGEQVTQKVMTPMDKKRKNRDGSSLTSAQSKDPKEVKGKKQRKCNGALNDSEQKKQQQLKAEKKNQKKVSEEPPTGYIHVRARRGQATDSHSLAERVRREKISERMKLLQALVPGCDKVIGKALMLDEIINYVQSLQNQVEFLSMKLASVNPMLYNFGMDQEAFMVRPERLSSLSSPPLPSMQQCSPTQNTAAFADATTTTTTTTTKFTTSTNNYPLLDSSLLLQQDNGSLLWDVDDQRQKFINQSGFSSNLCTFH